MSRIRVEKITGIEEEIRQLENRRRQLVQEQKAQERRDRTKRLCRRMGLFESLVPDSIPLTEKGGSTNASLSPPPTGTSRPKPRNGGRHGRKPATRL